MLSISHSRFDSDVRKTKMITGSPTQPDLFETGADFRSAVRNFSYRIEFGRTILPQIFQIFSREKFKPQPHSNKNFWLITSLILLKIEKRGYVNILNCLKNEKQIDRLIGNIKDWDPNDSISKVSSWIHVWRDSWGLSIKNRLLYWSPALREEFHRYKTRAKSSKSKALTIKEAQKALHPGTT